MRKWQRENAPGLKNGKVPKWRPVALVALLFFSLTSGPWPLSPASVFASRLWTTGFEENNLSTGTWTSITNSPTITTSNPHSGTYALLIDAAEWVSRAFSSVTSGTFYLGGYLYVNSVGASGAARVLAAFRNSTPTTVIELQLTTAKVLQITNKLTGTTKTGPTLNVGQHYLVEIKYVAADSGGSVEWRVDGVDQTAITGEDTLNTNVASFILGGDNSGISLSIQWDDVYFNDSNGSFQNSWRGAIGGIYMLEPNADVSVQFTQNGGAGSNFGGVNELPGTFDDVLYNSSTTTNHVDRLGLTALGSEVPSDAVIFLADVYARIGGIATSGVRQSRVKIWDESGTLTNGPTTSLNDINGWSLMGVADHLVYNASGKTKSNFDSFDAGYELLTNNQAQVSALWVNVEWKPAPTAVARRRILVTP